MPGYVDTNVLVRLVVRSSPQQEHKALRLICCNNLVQAHKALQLIRDNSPVRVHSAIMLETAFVLLRTYRRSRATVAQTLASILKSPRFVVDERAVWTLTLDLFTSTSLHLVDCHVAAR